MAATPFYNRSSFQIVSLIGFSISFLLGCVIYNQESSSIQKKFVRDVDEQIASFEDDMQLNLEFVYSIRSFFDGSTHVGPEDFSKLTQGLVKRHDSVKNLAWSQRIYDSNLYPFELNINNRHLGYQVDMYRDSLGKIFPVEKQDYYPITFIEPLSGNKNSLGLRMGAKKERLKQLEHIQRSGDLLVSNNFIEEASLFQGTISIILPVYYGMPQTVENRVKKIRGYAMATFNTDEVLGRSIERISIKDVNFLLVENSDKETLSSYKAKNNYATTSEKIFTYTKKISSLGNEQWEIQAHATTGYVAARRTLVPYFVSLSFALIYFIVITQFYRLMESTVNRKTYELREANKEFEKLSLTDGLTQVGNRRFFDDYYSTEWLRAFREVTPLSLLMIDVDHFKLYNDTYGHAKGDECLKRLANALSVSLNRPADRLCRYGGEEFIIVLPNTHNTVLVAEACRVAVEALQMEHKSSTTSDVVTVSIGAATIVPNLHVKRSAFVEQVDALLYLAKKLGRNRVVHDVAKRLPSSPKEHSYS